VVSYSPLARGVLSGKYGVNTPTPADSRAGRGDKRLQQTEWRPESLKIAQTIAQHAAERGTTSIAFALAWVLKNKLISATIAGPRTEAQWDSYIDALSLQLDAADEKLVDSLVVPGHTSTHGYTDPGYPVQGRKCG
jgi:aryl-alcohol dehydrogenase (NADP+)